MGNQVNTSKDYSSANSFGQPFKKAHSEMGPGSTFSYNGKSYNTNCADEGNYRTKPLDHTYTKDSSYFTRTGTFKTNSNEYDARSGLHPISSMKYGQIPDGDYKVSSISNTGGINRYNLEPQQNIGNRTNLQIHQKSDNILKNVLGTDTKGCISVDKGALNNIHSSCQKMISSIHLFAFLFFFTLYFL
jgi:hypothetical protein